MRILFFCICFLALPAMVLAYYPEAGKIAAQLRKEYKSLDAYQVVISFEKEPDLELRLWQQGQNWRQEWVKKSSGKAGIVAAAIGFKGKFITRYPSEEPVPVPVLDLWNQEKPYIWWQDMGVDTNIKSYQFFKHRPCLVLGAGSNELKQAQIWIDNKNKVPLRVYTDDNLEWQWYKYHNIGNFLVPHKARLISAQGRSFVLNIAWGAINKKIPPKLFSKREFEEKFAGVPAPSSKFSSKLLQQLKLVIPLAESAH